MFYGDILCTQLIGSPNDEDLGFLRNVNTQRYIRQLPRFVRQPLAQKYPRINAEAIDLIDRMLVFDPAKRITGQCFSWYIRVCLQVRDVTCICIPQGMLFKEKITRYSASIEFRNINTVKKKRKEKGSMSSCLHAIMHLCSDKWARCHFILNTLNC